jgi:hypothetical protein
MVGALDKNSPDSALEHDHRDCHQQGNQAAPLAIALIRALAASQRCFPVAFSWHQFCQLMLAELTISRTGIERERVVNTEK